MAAEMLAKNHGYVCKACDNGIPLFELLPRWEDLCAYLQQKRQVWQRGAYFDFRGSWSRVFIGDDLAQGDFDDFLLPAFAFAAHGNFLVLFDFLQIADV